MLLVRCHCFAHRGFNVVTKQRSYADRADSATSFDPELQFDLDIDRTLKADARAEREDALNRLRAISDFRQRYPL